MKQAAFLPLLYDAQATGGWTAGMVRVTRAMLEGAPGCESAARPGVAARPGPIVLEVGCGLGAVAHALQAAYPGACVFGVDLHPLALGGARGNERPTFAQADLTQLPFPAFCVDLLLALDSFDQVGVDLQQALAEAHRVLRPNGMLLLRVSAHPCLQGAHDVAFNTGRRYTRAEVAHVLANAGFVIKRKSYANALLAPPTVALRLLDQWRGGETHLSQTAASVYAATTANAAVQAALTLESHWLRRANLPIGLSLMVLAEKRGAG